MTNQQSTKLAQPRVGSLHDPASLIAAQFTSIFIASLRTILAVRHDQVDASLPQSLSQRIGIVSRICNHSGRLLSRTAWATRDADLGEGGFRKLNFMAERHFPAELPAEYLDRRPIPSILYPCHAWFYRRQSPFFSWSKTAVEKGLVPLQQAFLVQSAQQGSPRLQPDALLFPLLQPPPTGGRGRKFLWQKTPGCAGLQNPQDPFETVSIGFWWPAMPVLSSLRRRKQWLN